MRINRILFLGFLLIASKLFGQDVKKSEDFYLSAYYSKGFIYAHHASFKYFIKDYVRAFDFNLSKKTDGSKSWHQLYHFPTVAFGYNYTDYGNPSILGHSNTIYTFIEFPIFQRNRVSFSYKCSAGTAWLSKCFDLYNNKYNIAIGSKLNAYLNLNLNFDFKLSDQFFLSTGVGMSHFSNGGTQQPNKGINIFSIQGGLRYKINKEKNICILDTIPKFKKKNEYSLILSQGWKTLDPAQTKKNYVMSVSINAERQISYKKMIGLGLDLFKDNSRKEYLLIENIQHPHGKDLFYAGGHVSYDLVFGKTSFTIQMGAYFWQKAKYFETVYNRFGLKYRFSQHWMANLTLKTFWAAADFAEWGIGYRF